MAEDIPQLPQKIEIKPDWYNQRDDVLSKSEQIANGIQSQEDWENAEFFLTKITKAEKELEKQRKAIDKPFRDVAKRVKQVADEANAPLAKRKSEIKQAMQEYNKKIQEQRQKELEEQAQKAQESDPFTAELTKQEEPETKKPRQTTTVMVTVKKFEIKNSNQVPREYCRPDERLIREAVQKQGVTEIPGVEIWTEQEPRSR